MATGRRPFEGATSAALMSAILKDTPPRVMEARRDLPHHLQRVVERCLAKAPHDRIQTARDVYLELAELRRSLDAGAGHVGSGARPARARSEVPWIAVLPFTHRGSDPEVEAFAGGLAEDVTTGLSRFS